MAGCANHYFRRLGCYFGSPRQSDFGKPGSTLRLLTGAALVALFEFGQNFLRDKLNRRTQHVVGNTACLGQADHLIDTCSLEFA